MALGQRLHQGTGAGGAERPYLDDRGAEKPLREIKKEVSNARIMALGLESAQVHWVIGKKSYEPEKIRVFLEAWWNRLLWLMTQPAVSAEAGELEKVLDYCRDFSGHIKELSQGVQRGDDMTGVAVRLFQRLKEGTTAFLRLYFQNKYLRLLE